MKRNAPFLLLFVLLITACDEATTPRPKGYFKIDFPEKKYLLFEQEGYPYAFEYPAYGTVVKDSTFFETTPENPYWVNIDFPQFGAKIYLSYKMIGDSNKIELLINDAFRMTGKHSIKASYIDEIPVRGQAGVSGFIFDVGGNVATGKQFYITDSTRHFLRGALYFEATPNFDSLQPAENFLYQDIQRLIQTLRWK